MAQIARYCVFHGNVQGVGFRRTVEALSKRSNVSGFVRNLPNGDVELLVQGEYVDCDDFIARVSRVMGSHIQQLLIEDRPIEHRDGFVIAQ